MLYEFTPAVKPAARARVALIGAPGAGKIYTALTLATGWGGTVGVIDTTGSAARYAHLFPHVTLPVRSFDPKDLPAIVAVATESGIDTLIVSTLTSYYSGTNGTLERVGALTRDSHQANAKSQAWDTVRPDEQAALDALSTFSGHVIVTLRAKPEIIHDRDDSGQVVPRVVGTKPDHREGILFWPDLGIIMTAGTAVVVKTRAPALEQRCVRHPTGDFAQEILAALADGAVGEPFDARAIRSWAFDEARTCDELQARAAQLAQTGHDQVLLLGDSGRPVPLGEIVRHGWKLANQRARGETGPVGDAQDLGAAVLGAAA